MRANLVYNIGALVLYAKATTNVGRRTVFEHNRHVSDSKSNFSQKSEMNGAESVPASSFLQLKSKDSDSPWNTKAITAGIAIGVATNVLTNVLTDPSQRGAQMLTGLLGDWMKQSPDSLVSMDDVSSLLSCIGIGVLINVLSIPAESCFRSCFRRLKCRFKLKETPLHMAARRGQSDMVKLLLEHGADIEARNAMRRTPLHEAVGVSVEVMEILLDWGAQVNAQDRYQMTPLNIATATGYSLGVALLVQRGAAIKS